MRLTKLRIKDAVVVALILFLSSIGLIFDSLDFTWIMIIQSVGMNLIFASDILITNRLLNAGLSGLNRKIFRAACIVFAIGLCAAAIPANGLPLEFLLIMLISLCLFLYSGWKTTCAFYFGFKD